MDAIDRRSALRGILCVAVVAGFSASSFPNTVEAMPLALEKRRRKRGGRSESQGSSRRQPSVAAPRPSAAPPRSPSAPS
jgi:hypothetical protein